MDTCKRDMAHVVVRATAVRWEADDFPGWIEVELLDTVGRAHRIVEKVPVLTTANVTEASTFPFEMWLRAEVERVEADAVVVRLMDGVETTDGLDQISMELAAVRWL